MRRRLIAHGALALGLTACASASPPPGGPEDHAPPQLVRITPDSNAVNVTARDVSFVFDETINDRGTGAQEVRNYFLVSPSVGEPDVSWHRSRVDVRPHRGFRPNTAYTVTLLPGLTDLRGNPMRTGRSVVFSTGPTIPKDRITGTAIDWVADRPANRALIQGVTPDSISYLAQSDSVGRFSLGPLPPGRYLVRAITDQNSNHVLDRNEPFDSVTVVVPQASKEPLELRIAPRDTLAPRILTVTTADSLRLRATFDRLLDPRQRLTPEMFRLIGADSVTVPITAVLDPQEEARLAREADRARADSVRRADSLAGKPLPPAPAAPAAQPAPTRPASAVPPPYTTILLKLGRPLTPATAYRLSTTGARSVTGRSHASERSFTVPRPAPRPPAPSDSTRRPAAGTTRRPAAPPRPPS